MNSNQNSYETIGDLWRILKSNTKAFGVSLIVALVLAFAYIVVAPPVFKRKASILIEDNSSNANMSTQSMPSFGGVGVFGDNSNIKNEMNVIQTPKIIREVVEVLNLDCEYYHKEKFYRWSSLYNNSPIEVEVDSLSSLSSINFKIEVLSDDFVKVTDLELDEVDYDISSEGKFTDTIRFDVGYVIVKKSALYTDESIGELFSFSKTPIEDAAKEISLELRVSLRSDDASVVDIVIDDEVPARADDILNTIISVYNENWIENKNLITLSTLKFIDARLVVIEQELGIVDNDISTFKSKHLMHDINSVATSYLAQSTENITKQLDLNNQLSMAKYIKQYLEDATTINQLLPVNTGIENSGIEKQIAMYNELLLQKNNLLSNSSTTNPLIANMIANLTAMKDVINRSANDLIQTLTIQIDNAIEEEKRNKRNIASSPSQERYLLSVGRQQKVKEELYLYLLQQREDKQLSKTFTAYNTVILAAADGPIFPEEPKKHIVLLLALALGVILPMLFLIVQENFQTSVRSKSDLSALTIPFIGSLPLIATNKKRRSILKDNNKNKNVPKPYIVIQDKNRNEINEAFRVIRTNLDLMQSTESPNKAMMLISFNPGSGKSFISANLAITMALKGSKVIAVDVDMRKAALSEYVGSPRVGLSSYLTGKVEHIEDVILRGRLHENLDFLPVGALPPNPSELLLTDKFKNLIETLKQRYDYIFLDCTPVDIVPDAAIVGKLCDMTIFVIRAELMDKRMLPDLEAMYLNKKYKNISILLNGVNHKKNSYYGYGTYGDFDAKLE